MMLFGLIRVHSDSAVSLLPALLVLGAGVTFVLWQHRRDFPASHPDRVRRVWLPLIRALIVGTLGWLLIKPVVSRWRTTKSKPRLLAVVDSSPGMATIEDCGGVHRKMAVLSMLEDAPVAGRDIRASRLAEHLHHLRGVLARGLGECDLVLGDVDQGLPVPPALIRHIDALHDELARLSGSLPAAPAADRPALKTEPIREAMAGLASDRSGLASLCEVILNDAELVGREAAEHLQLLRDARERMAEAAQVAGRLEERCWTLQGTVDEALLDEAVLTAFGQRQVTRGDLSRMAAQRLVNRVGHLVDVEIREAAGVAAALAAVFHAHLESPLCAVVLFSDGIGGLDCTRLPPVPVHTVLAGRDGHEPADLALIAVEAPRVAVAGEPLTARLLLKNRLAAGSRSVVAVRVDGDMLLERDLGGPSQDLQILELPLELAGTGRSNLVFRLAATGGSDAYEGNEQQRAVVDVLPARPRVVLLTGGIRNEFAAIRRCLAHVSVADVAELLAAPEIRDLKIGTGPDEFPQNAKAGEGIALAVLLGDIPAALRRDGESTALTGLREAVAQGLHVYVRDDGGKHGWARFFGLASEPVSPPRTVMPVSKTWHAFYRLRVDRAASLQAWRDLGVARSVRGLAEALVPLLQAGGRTVVGIVPRGEGMIVYDGWTGLLTLRNPATETDLNRLLAGLLTRALQPVGETPARGVPAPTSVAHELAPRAAVLREVADATGGTFVDLPHIDQLRIETRDYPVRTLLWARSWRLWHGGWPLPLLLLLVVAEYLLRRRAGRVM